MKDTKIPYLLKGTPSVLLVLGAGFVMASSSDIRAALGMGAAVLLAMLLSSIVVSATHKIIPAYAKMPAYLLIITGFVSLIGMLMQAIFPTVTNMLGVHLATVAVSAVVYRDCEEVADHNGEATSIKTALVTGAFFTVIMLVCALIREVLGNGTIWGVEIAFLQDYKISSLAGAFGGYLVLAIVMAVINKVLGINLHHHEQTPAPAEEEAKAEAPATAENPAEDGATVEATAEATENVAEAETTEATEVAEEATEATEVAEETTEAAEAAETAEKEAE